MKKSLVITGTILSSLVATSGINVGTASANATDSSEVSYVSPTEQTITRSDFRTTTSVKTHKVVKGDTLSSIARKYNVTLSNLISWNPQISNPNRISIGQVINLSKVSSTTTNSPSVTSPSNGSYTVKKGDTLSKIAKNYKTTVSSIMKLNPSIKDANKIRVGQVIKISGTVSNSSTTTTTPPTVSNTQTSNTSQVSKLITAAKKYIGKPYSYGANGPSAFDCSSFVQQSFKDIGVTIPRSSIAQSTSGKVVPISSVKQGDLVFFDTDFDGTINHVGIYIGNNQMIHCGTSRGVEISTTSSSYWKPRLVKAVRIL